MVAARQEEKGWNGRKEEVYSLPIKGNPRGGVSYMETNDAKKKSTMHPLHIVSENHKRFLHHIKENLRDMEKQIKSWEYVSNRAKRQNAHCKNQLHRYIITMMMNDGVIFWRFSQPEDEIKKDRTFQKVCALFHVTRGRGELRCDRKGRKPKGSSSMKMAQIQIRKREEN